MSDKVDEINIEIYSESIDDIMGKEPSWILRRGITVFCLVIFALLILSWFIKYPDTITVPVSITSTNPPIEVLSPSCGRIQSLLVKNKQIVETGEYLAILENQANPRSINRLRSLIHLLDSSLYSRIIPVSYDASIPDLGLLELPYHDLIHTLNMYHLFCSSFEDKDMEVDHLQQFNIIDYQLKTPENEVPIDTVKANLINDDYDSFLHTAEEKASGILAKETEPILNNNQSSIDYEADLSLIRLKKDNLETQKRNCRITENKEKQVFIDKACEIVYSLKNQLTAWENSYVVKSPESGTVLFWKNLKPNQLIESGEVIMFIKPDKNERIIGMVPITIKNKEDIKVNQKVMIKLYNFPYPDFGVLTGKISYISNISHQGNFLLEIDLPDGLTTNYNKQIPLAQNMEGTAEIITANKRFLIRLFEPLHIKGNNNER